MKVLTLLATQLVALAAAVAATSPRFVMYHDEWHPTRPTNPSDRAVITHLILAFAQANNTAAYKPHVSISTLRDEYPSAKLSIAIGGWGDTIGFTESTKSQAGIDKFANDIKTLVATTGVDGIDIDWEYPGGNGADYKQVPNSAKVHEIGAFPKLLQAIREAIGKDKILSIAVPGKKGDMIAFTKETGPLIWPSVDHVNIMSYDLMNRRDAVTSHHTSVAGAAQAVQNYLDIGAPPSKINLGFAYYAKYFTTTGDCTASPLNCQIAIAEDPITGADTLTSGAWTFEKAHMQAVNGSALPVSTDGTCGADKGTRCASGCCSQYGNCGTSKEHCSGACQHAFGTGCTDADIAGSWQNAASNGVTDTEAGGQYYFDAANKLFWTWDTKELIARKFQDVVAKYGLGGVMAWSLGEDSNDWSHIRAMTEGLKTINGIAPPQANAASKDKTETKTQVATKPTPASNQPGKTTYDVVYVDGIGGPEAEESVIPAPKVNPTSSLTSSKPKNAVGKPVVKVSNAEPGPNDDWEWVYYDSKGRLWQDNKKRMRIERA
ncbi:unnamed protein product [Periconia digitata]|uniref:chitinase n=1 Tax=Periconia digitata TaxID=1303443 RepID=A0A9W4US25_9PLEO|nr:unnamed protein product [Periconia digitata]